MTAVDAPVPHHVAIIMDGNGRWAQSRGQPRTEGHRQGEERLAETVRTADDLGISWLTVYGFSTENWRRPKLEVDFILGLHKNIFGRREEMHENNVRIRWIGRPDPKVSRVPRLVRREIDKSVALTRDNTGLTFTVAFDYGGREELVHAARGLLGDGDCPVTDRDIERHLYAPDLPRVDLLIRSSGEYWLSNFLLWQVPGALFYVTPTYWPDFGRSELEAAVDWWHQAIVPGDRTMNGGEPDGNQEATAG